MEGGPIIPEVMFPQRKLDFHEFSGQSLHPTEIQQTAREFLEECVGNELVKVEIVTGRGNNSENGRAIVKPVVRALLNQMRGKLIRNFEEKSGGGAFDVYLKNAT